MIMKKKIMNVALVCAVVVFAGINVLKSQKLDVVHDLMLDEVEAEAQINPEIQLLDQFYLYKYKSGCSNCERMEHERCNIHDQIPC